MKPEPTYREELLLRHYIESVAQQVGVEATAVLCECGTPSTAYVALADTSRAWPGRLLMLAWSSDDGWRLALEPESGEPPVIVAAWPEPVRPAPARVARRLQNELRTRAQSAATVAPTPSEIAAHPTRQPELASTPISQ
ncbi:MULTISPECIES: DUF6292 family protein [unclassified Amycolatopsis]|uniref:DUF6292 family protein n=1 Tax=unclassified Amycolatopsis TaxID=2618356 RepID=UPI001C6A0CDB|nr:DUF6292 family protein [Amycolatopsis sp. DSM 110486]QYN19111.1 hypothetical protein K1T34_41660 [Amycolatopsis sp. DSM 110486]